MKLFPEHKGRFIASTSLATYLLLVSAAFIGSDSIGYFANVPSESQAAQTTCWIPGVGCTTGASGNQENLIVTVRSWSLPPYGGKGELRVKTHGYKSMTGVTAICTYKNTDTGQTKERQSDSNGNATVKDFGPINGTTRVKINCTNYYNTYTSSDATSIYLKNSPTFTLSADPTTLTYSGTPVTSNITWGVGNDYNCRLTGPGVSITKTEEPCASNTVTAVPFSSAGTYTYNLEYQQYIDENGNGVWGSGGSVTITVENGPTDLCTNIGGVQTTYPANSGNSCTCPAGRTFNSTTYSCDTTAPADLCTNIGGVQTTYPANSGNSCTCPAGRTFNSTTYSCDTTAPVVAAPTLTIQGSLNGGSTYANTPITMTVGQSLHIRGTFAAASGDTLTATALNDYANNALPGVPNNTAASPKSYTFTPTAQGSYVFYPAAKSTAYPAWNNYGRALNVMVLPASSFSCVGSVPANATPCPSDEVGLSSNTARTVAPACSMPAGSAPKCQYTCQSGFTRSGNTCIPTTPVTSCSDVNLIPPACTSCQVGYLFQGGVCVLATCDGAHEVNWPACTCATGYVRDIPSDLCVAQPALLLTVNGQPTTRVQKGSSVDVEWDATGVRPGTCSVRTSANETISNGVDSGTAPHTVTAQTIYRLTCLNEAGGVVVDEATVNLIPTYIES